MNHSPTPPVPVKTTPPTVSEEKIERLFDSIAMHNDRQDSERWLMAYQASKVYGLYETHAVKAIADRTGVTRSAVKNWVNAYRCFKAIAAVDCRVAKTYRRAFTLTHFATMWEEMRKRDFDATKAIYFFYLLYTSKVNGDSYSVDALGKEINAHYHGYIGVNLNYHIERMEKEVDVLKSNEGLLPKRFRRWLAGWGKVKP